MNCEKIRKEMSVYIDGMLIGKKAKEFEEHLKSCESCSNEFDELKGLIDEINGLEQIELPENYHLELMEKITKTEVSQKKVRKPVINFRQYTGIAAGVVITLFAVSILGSLLGNIGIRLDGGNDNGTSVAYSVASDSNESVSQYAAGASQSEEIYFEESLPETARMLAPAAMPFGATGDKASGPQMNRKIVNIEISVTNLNEAVQAINSLNGYSTSQEVRYYNNGINYSDEQSKKYGYASITRRINDSELEFTRNVLRSLGEVINENESMEQYGVEYENNSIYAKNAQNEFNRLMVLMEKTQNLDVLIYIENRVSEVERSIDRYLGRMAEIEGFTAQPYINIHLTSASQPDIEPYSLEKPFGHRVKRAFKKSVSAVLIFFEGISVFAATAFIPAIIIGVTIFIIFTVYKRIRRGRR